MGTRPFTFADLLEGVADVVPDNTAVVCGEPSLHLRGARRAGQPPRPPPGRPRRRRRATTSASTLYNGTEWVEAMLGACKIRAVPINVNYRYVEDELRYLFDNADLVALVHGREFAPRIAARAARVARSCTRSSRSRTAADADLAAIGAVDYEAALAAASPERRLPARAPATTSTSSTPAAPPACPRA